MSNYWTKTFFSYIWSKNLGENVKNYFDFYEVFEFEFNYFPKSKIYFLNFRSFFLKSKIFLINLRINFNWIKWNLIQYIRSMIYQEYLQQESIFKNFFKKIVWISFTIEYYFPPYSCYDGEYFLQVLNHSKKVWNIIDNNLF